MMLLASGWCVTLGVDWLDGRIGWGAAALGVASVLAWLAWALRSRDPLSQPVRLCWVSHEAAAEADMDEGWYGEAGESLQVQVVFDLGRLVLLRITQTASRARAQLHWVDADCMSGPWRWRVMMASSQTFPSREPALSISPQRVAGRAA